jgi:peptidoglycan/LPS O-acetylase OafA/YrhL
MNHGNTAKTSPKRLGSTLLLYQAVRSQATVYLWLMVSTVPQRDSTALLEPTAAPRRARPTGRVASLDALAGILLIAYAIVSLDLETPFPGRWALLPVCGALLVLRASRQSG